MDYSTFVGLDVHKKSMSVALAEAGRASEVRFHGEISNTPDAMRRLVEKLERPGRRLHFCYEAGPCGMACIGCCVDWARIASWSRRR